MKRKNEPIDVKDLQGTYPAIITPMLCNGINANIDYSKFERLIDDLIKNKVDGILVAGTTGQSATLEHDEQIGFISHAFDYINGRTRLIASAGSNNTKEALELSKAIEDKIGPTTLLHVTGYYNNPPQEGLEVHYNLITDEINGNIIPYNVPSRTGSNIEASTAIKLSKNLKIIGIKEASGNMEQVETIINNTDPENFRLLSGEDHLVAPIMQKGGYGVISASANVAPRYFVDITKSALSGDYETANQLQDEVNQLVKNAVFAAKNPIPLAHMFKTGLRLPLKKVEGLDSQINEVLSKYTPAKLGVDLKRY
ncbi:4-hydroxy-tetrahydrodipicolinate synthase [archaeon]|jgi:4-hydroxy-tetrahydrodipicolinate synthase|nr:4-hydroxy-tetrahydrodipicolinate synthase [archaeon]MDP6547852.1 4-hydroxy-tetrahydrodipicolinate synthase [Candidatus Woesearchaeota archaeon]|tara:strand:- start:20934 stop:21866 length:933 start_codon:yes stop_codon:yes gene_type:complete